MHKIQETRIEQIRILSLDKKPNGLLKKAHYFEVLDKVGAPSCRVSIHKYGLKLAWKKAILSMAKINNSPPFVRAIRQVPRVNLQ